MNTFIDNNESTVMDNPSPKNIDAIKKRIFEFLKNEVGTESKIYKSIKSRIHEGQMNDGELIKLDRRIQKGLSQELDIITLLENNTNGPNIELIERLIETSVQDFLEGKKLSVFKEINDQEGFGEGRYHKRDVPEHTRQVIYNLRSYLSEYKEFIKNYFEDKVDGIEKITLFELACVFHDAGKKLQKELTGSMGGHAEYTLKNQIEEVISRFSLNEKQGQYISNVIQYHDTPIELDDSKNLRNRMKENGIYLEGLLLSLADIYATMGPLVNMKHLENRKEFVEKEIRELIE